VLEELGRDAEAEVWFERSERASDALDQAENPGDVDVIEVIELEEDPAVEDPAVEDPADSTGSDD
jgi:hypothetical protein